MVVWVIRYSAMAPDHKWKIPVAPRRVVAYIRSMSLAGHALRRVAAVAVAVALVGSTPDPFKALELVRPRKATQASAFTAETLEGQPLRLAQYKGKVVMLNFWATWCTPCREEMPAFQRLYDRHKAQGFVVIGLSVDAEGTSVVKPFVKEYGLTFPIGLDPKMDVAEKFSVRALPSTFLIDKEGKILAMALGPREWNSNEAHTLIRSLTASR